MKNIVVAGIALLVLAGCQSTQGGLYWGDYSETLYDYKKEPSDKTRAEHVESLFDVINKSKKLGVRVPPGVYAELGQMYLEEGKYSEGKQYLQLEVTTYPESQKLISIIQNRVTEE